MAYAAPSRVFLREGVARDVQDPTFETFTEQEINDLINEGIVELNRIRPKEYVGNVVLTDGVFDYDLYALARIIGVFKVEVWRDDAYYHSPLGATENSATGWDFFAGRLLIPSGWAFDATTDTLRIYGYADRDILTLDEEVLDAEDAEDEHLIRAYIKHTVFQRLVADRALYQQWQVQSNNTDVSPTQLLGMEQVYRSTWDRLRNRARRLRRVG